MTAQRPKIDVHAGMDAFAVFVQANTEFFGVAVQNKVRLLQWYKEAKEEDLKRVAAMYDHLIHNTNVELVDLHNHIELLGLMPELTPEPQKEGATANG